MRAAVVMEVEARAVTMKSATFITPGIKLNRFILFARKVDLLAFFG